MNTINIKMLSCTACVCMSMLCAPLAHAQTPAAPDAELPIAQLLASADKVKGESIAKKCVSCHSFDKGGAKKIGPNLYDIVDKPIAAAPDFKYSAAMTAKQAGKWDYATLYTYLKKPSEFAKGTTMSFVGIEKPQDRADLIAYLRGQSDTPKPLPK